MVLPGTAQFPKQIAKVELLLEFEAWEDSPYEREGADCTRRLQARWCSHLPLQGHKRSHYCRMHGKSS